MDQPEFAWDPREAAANWRKHRVRLVEAVTAFADPLSVTVPDHSDPREARYILIGGSERGRLLVVSHVERGTALRLISAREATRYERGQYEEGD